MTAILVCGIPCRLRQPRSRRIVAGVLQQIKTRFPRDFARLKTRIEMIRPLPKARWADGTMREWLDKRGERVLEIREVIEEDVFSANMAHELGHACTQKRDLKRRNISEVKEWESEAAADWYAYRWGIGKLIRSAMKNRKLGHHGPWPGMPEPVVITDKNGQQQSYRLSRNFVYHRVEQRADGEVVLPDPIRVWGKPLNHEGKPVAGAQLSLWTADSTPPDLAKYPFNWTMMHTGQLEQSSECRQFLTTTTDDRGLFIFLNVRATRYAEVDYWGTGIAKSRNPVDVTNAVEHAIWLTLRAFAPGRLIVEGDREAWPTAGQIAIDGNPSSFDYKNRTIRTGDSKVTFDDLPPGEFNVALQPADRSIGGDRIASDTLSCQSVTVTSGETTTVRFANP
jgi:hypothetical protein